MTARLTWRPKRGQADCFDGYSGLRAKHEKNVVRKWPAPVSEDLPSEHDRSEE
jgi:hypothetical protein